MCDADASDAMNRTGMSACDTLSQQGALPLIQE